MRSEELCFYDEKNIGRERIVTTNEQSLLDELFCPICLCLLWKPRSCATCQNLFCRECIRAWLTTNSSTCPLCRASYEDQPAPVSVQASLARLCILCRNSPFGCAAILSYNSLEHHEETDCRFRSATCRLCAEALLLKDVDRHQRLCKPMVTECSLCHCWVPVGSFQRHQTDCLEQYSARNEDLAGPSNVFEQPILLPISAGDLFGMESFDQSRKKDCLTRLLAVLRLIATNFSMIHLILFNLLVYGLGNFIYTSTSLLLSIQTWCRGSNHQVVLLWLALSAAVNYNLGYLMQSMNDSTMVLVVVLSLTVWSSLDSELQIRQFQMDFNHKELLLFWILSLLFLQFSITITRLCLQYIPTLARTVGLTMALTHYLTLAHRSPHPAA